ncbi:MAG: CPBP family intramembrane metalloprotease [Coriobacteriales bacterium]|jgi:membrane protease YdiL (CAAX protease family)|nr:CPBP family intramembrane metalloprotease [Coriobacteriales bacterium]
MMSAILVLLLLVYMALSVVMGLREVRSARQAQEPGQAQASAQPAVRAEETRRLRLYRATILQSWGVTLCLGLVALAGGFTLSQLGLGAFSQASFGVNPVFATVAFVVCGGFCVYLVAQCIYLQRNHEALSRAWQQTEKDAVAAMLIPRSLRERRLFLLVALTAGICEEFVMRGLAFALLQDFFPGMSVYLLPVVAGLVFGAMHAYQGVAGVAKTGALGALLGCLYLATGTLYPAMLAHFVIDATNCLIAPPERAADTDGAHEASESLAVEPVNPFEAPTPHVVIIDEGLTDRR